MSEMENNPKVQINWGVFNIPTILAIGGLLWATADRAARQDLRLDAIETSRIRRSVEIDKVVEQLSTKVVPIDNIQYRLTVAEQGIADVNRRADRINEAVSSRLDKVQESINLLTTKFEVLDQRLQNALPSDTPPRELRPHQ